MRISQNFTLAELTFSRNAARAGRDNTVRPGTLEAANLERLVFQILEPSRAAIANALGYDVPLIITSGYRSEWTNAEAGGAENSQHLEALAADGYFHGVSVADAFDILRATDIPFDQLIAEFGAWLHFSTSRALTEPRREFLVASNYGGRVHFEQAASAGGLA